MPRTLEIHHLDVGQGECTLIRCIQDGSEVCCVIDGGHTTRGGETLQRYLTQLGISRVDFLLCTHTDADHIEGLTYLLEKTTFCDDKTLVFYNDTANSDDKVLKLRKAAKTEEGTRLKVLNEGDTLFLTSGRNKARDPHIQCLLSDSGGANVNNRSIASLIVFRSFKYFTAGDLESAYELGLFEKKQHICAHKAGHHGSAKSTSDTLLRQLTPSAVFISCGIHSYCHPDQPVITHLHQERSVQRFYLTNCYYDRVHVNPDNDQSDDTLKAVVAGGTNHLGTLVLRLDDAGALNHRFEVLYSMKGTVRRDVIKCHDPSALVSAPLTGKVDEERGWTRAFDIRHLAGLDVGLPRSSWMAEVRKDHDNKPFSLPTKPPPEEREEKALSGRDLRYMRGKEYDERLPTPKKRGFQASCAFCGEGSENVFDDIVEWSCTGCRDRFSVHTRCWQHPTTCPQCASKERQDMGSPSSTGDTRKRQKLKHPASRCEACTNELVTPAIIQLKDCSECGAMRSLHFGCMPLTRATCGACYAKNQAKFQANMKALANKRRGGF